MGIETVGSPLLFAGFGVLVAALLFVDLGVFHKDAHVVRPKEALVWTGVWVGVALLFAAFVGWRFGSLKVQEYLAGYALEKALSVDNLFVMYAVFAAFAVDPVRQHRVLFWGIVGAVVMRAVMIFAGTALLARFHWLVFVFGGVLVFTGVKMLLRRDERPRPEDSRLLRLARRFLPVTDDATSGRMFTRVDGRLAATPLFLALLAIEGADAVFAVDSIFAIFAVTTDPFIVLTSNVFAILGLRSLYFVLAGAAERFRYVQPGLALVLVLVGVKMAISDWVHVPVLASLAGVVVLVGGSVAASLWANRRDRRRGARDAAASAS